ncbi:hypothetical protein G7Y79_00001g003400 [Physcia stellaris]|nr:hypothetical protein G7Y79_00001g003400 [Physcia stellaris]
MQLLYLTVLLWLLCGCAAVLSYSVYNWLKNDDTSTLAKLVCKPGTLDSPSFRSYMTEGTKAYLRHTADVILFFYVLGEAAIGCVYRYLEIHLRNLSDLLHYDFGGPFRDLPPAYPEILPLLGDRTKHTANQPVHVHDKVYSTRSPYGDSSSTSMTYCDTSPPAVRATTGADGVGREENGPNFLRWPLDDKQYQERKERQDAMDREERRKTY